MSTPYGLCNIKIWFICKYLTVIISLNHNKSLNHNEININNTERFDWIDIMAWNFEIYIKYRKM